MLFWMMNGWNRGMGPRGPIYGHRGRGGFGFGGLLLLPALLFGGWIILAVVGGLIGAVIMILGSIFSGLGALAEGVFSQVFSGGGLAVGIVIGLWMYYRYYRARKVKEEE